MELSPKLIIQWSEMHSHRVCASRFLLFLSASSRHDLIAVGEFTYCCLQFDDLTISPNFHFGVAIRCSSSDKPRQIVQPADFAPVERQDNVALLQAGLCTGAVLGNNRNNSAVLALQAEACRNRGRYLLNLDAEPAAADLSVLLELRDNGLGDVRRNLSLPRPAASSRASSAGAPAKGKRHVGAMALSDFTFRSVAVEETTLLYRLNRYARGRVPARAGGVRRLPQDYEKGN
jgi:hypothetical protein